MTSAEPIDNVPGHHGGGHGTWPTQSLLVLGATGDLTARLPGLPGRAGRRADP